MGKRPLICLDIDGVVNLLDLPGDRVPAGVKFELIDGVPHALAHGVRENISRMRQIGDIAWATGWGSRANRLLSPALGLPPLGEVVFEKYGTPANAYWKADGIARYAGDRPVAWLDDALDLRCQAWAGKREQMGQPTLLVPVEPETGLTEDEVARVVRWAGSLGIEPGPGSDG